jgi:phytanoyl-CoA hydroxylase
MTEKERFDNDGLVIYRDVLDAKLVSEANAHVDWLMKKHPELRPEDLNHTLVQHDPFWVRLVSDDRLLDIVEQFIGPDIALFASHYICKPPHDGQAVLWHQDGSYWPLDPMEVVTLWLAVTDASPDNGCMRVIPGTQDMDLQELRQRRDIPNVLNSEMDRALVDEQAAVDCVMAPGDVSVHHPNVIHGSNPNTSSRWRRGLTIRYIPTTTRIGGIEHPGPHPSAFHLRGNAPAGVNEYNPKPVYVPGNWMAFDGCEMWEQR